MLKKAYLEITNVCNMSCSFCHKTSRSPRTMTEEEFDILTDKLRGKIKYLYFHLMGEPTIHPFLPEFIKSAKGKGFLPVLTTNGTLLGDKRDELLRSLPHKINVSLHAPSANESFADGSYLDNCIGFAKVAAQNGCYIAFRLWNLGSENEKDNDGILKKLHSEFASEWENMKNRNAKKLSDKIYLEYAERFEWPDINKEDYWAEDMFCYGLRDQIGILCDGTVVPCCLDSDGIIDLGNLFENSLDDILSRKRAKAIYNGFSNRTAVENLCKKCGYAQRFSLNKRR